MLKPHDGRQHVRLEDRSLARLKPRPCSGPELLAFDPAILLLVHRRAAHECRCLLLATHLILEAVVALPRIKFSGQI